MLKMKNLLVEAPEDVTADIEKAQTGGLSTAVSIFSKIASDPDFQKIANAGKTDGDAGDEVIAVKDTTTKASDLYATQMEIGFDKSLKDAMTNEFQCVDFAFESKVLMGSPDGRIPLLTAQVAGKKVVLDGHHRWSLCFMINPEANMAVTEMQMPSGATDEDALIIMQMAIAAKAGDVQTKTISGQDLMGVGSEVVKKYVLENIKPEGIEAFEKGDAKLNSAEAIADHMAAAHKIILKRKGEFERAIMPQAGKSGTSQDAVNTALGQGTINFSEPKPSDVKEEGIDLKRRFQKIAKIKG